MLEWPDHPGAKERYRILRYISKTGNMEVIVAFYLLSWTESESVLAWATAALPVFLLETTCLHQWLARKQL